MAMQKRGRLSEADFRKMDDNDPRKKRWQQVNKKYGEQGKFQDNKKATESSRGRAKQLASDYAASQQDKSKTSSQSVQDRRQALSSRSSDRSSERKDSYATAQSIQQDRRRQKADPTSLYSRPQEERDQQDRNRGAQRLGATSEGQKSLNRERERIERPTPSETTEVEKELHSANKFSNTPQATKAESENLKNSRDPWR